jgi:nicotinamidase-related amidase
MKSAGRRILMAIILACSTDAAPTGSGTLTLTTRSRKESSPGSGRFESVQQVVRWDPHRSAVIICDMWDKHWCDGATKRVGELAPVMNEIVRAARRRGVFIIHAPSETMAFYQETPQRHRAQQAPKAPAPPASERPAEPPLPIDDSDGGCDTGQPPWHQAWTRQHPAIEIAPEDAISDNGDELYNLLQQRGIDNVILMGVHTNIWGPTPPPSVRATSWMTVSPAR